MPSLLQVALTQQVSDRALTSLNIQAQARTQVDNNRLQRPLAGFVIYLMQLLSIERWLLGLAFAQL